jgi:hypothetical protein
MGFGERECEIVERIHCKKKGEISCIFNTMMKFHVPRKKKVPWPPPQPVSLSI